LYDCRNSNSGLEQAHDLRLAEADTSLSSPNPSKSKTSTSSEQTHSVDVRNIVLEQMKKGRRDDHLANCVLSRLGWYGNRGFEEYWPKHPSGYTPFLDVQWHWSCGSYATWASKRRIEKYEQELLDGGYLDLSPINPFQEKESQTRNNPLSSEELVGTVSQGSSGTDSTEPEEDVSLRNVEDVSSKARLECNTRLGTFTYTYR
jgi:hypothetical protein